jgi:hypothetical protein
VRRRLKKTKNKDAHKYLKEKPHSVALTRGGAPLGCSPKLMLPDGHTMVEAAGKPIAAEVHSASAKADRAWSR